MEISKLLDTLAYNGFILAVVKGTIVEARLARQTGA